MDEVRPTSLNERRRYPFWRKLMERSHLRLLRFSQSLQLRLQRLISLRPFGEPRPKIGKITFDPSLAQWPSPA